MTIYLDDLATLPAPSDLELEEMDRRAGAVLSMWRWETLWEVFQAQDERQTLLDARNAGCP